MSAQQIVRHLRAIADQGAPGGQHGLASVRRVEKKRNLRLIPDQTALFASA